MTDADKCHSLQ